MTIGWATLGHVWSKPIMMVAVRRSRHAFSLIDTAEDFAVTIPASGMDKEIMFCVTKSGRDFDKFKECDLLVLDGQNAETPVISLPGFHYECKIVYKSAMDSANLSREYDASLYADNDYHTLYFGEIMDCYEI